MLPVSGAEQLRASGAIHGLRPAISASGAYWRFVNPPPSSWTAGRNKVPQPAFAGARLEPFDDRWGTPPVIGLLDLLAESPLGRVHALVHERQEPLAQLDRRCSKAKSIVVGAV